MKTREVCVKWEMEGRGGKVRLAEAGGYILGRKIFV
jgi:hypothetical protein